MPLIADKRHANAEAARIFLSSMSQALWLYFLLLYIVGVYAAAECSGFPNLSVSLGACGSGTEYAYQLVYVSFPLSVETTSNWTASVGNVSSAYW